MRITCRSVVAALFGLSLLASNVSAKRIAIPPLADRIGKADAIVAGKVTALEDKKIKLPGGGEAILATIKIEQGLLGVKDLTHVKVAIQPGTLEASQEACFFLQQVKGETYFMLPLRFFFPTIRKEEGNYAAQLDAIKRGTALLADPMKGLQAKDSADRLLTAALLLAKYRPWGEDSQKTEAIDAAQSKLILEALADADWKKFDNTMQVNAQTVFTRLGLTPADGWKVVNFQQLEQEAKTWLKANAGTYRVKRFVAEK